MPLMAANTCIQTSVCHLWNARVNGESRNSDWGRRYWCPSFLLSLLFLPLSSPLNSSYLWSPVTSPSRSVWSLPTKCVSIQLFHHLMDFCTHQVCNVRICKRSATCDAYKLESEKYQTPMGRPLVVPLDPPVANTTKDAVSVLLLLLLLLMTCIVIVGEDKPETSANCMSGVSASCMFGCPLQCVFCQFIIQDVLS